MLMRVLSLCLFPLVKSNVLLTRLCCGEAAELSEGMSELNLVYPVLLSAAQHCCLEGRRLLYTQ